MADAFIGEIRVFAGNYAPYDWAFCNGQLMSVSQYPALFSILGNRYGGDGKTTFALPNLLGLAPMHQGAGPGLTERTIGEQVGTKTVMLDMSEMPIHTHTPVAINSSGKIGSPANQYWAESEAKVVQRKKTQTPLYASPVNMDQMVQMSEQALAMTGGGQPHNNMQPYLALNFIICIYGVYPVKS